MKYKKPEHFNTINVESKRMRVAEVTN